MAFDRYEVTISAAAIVGAFIGLGKLLAEGDDVTARKVAGRAITSGGLGIAGSLIVVAFPDVPPYVLLGAGCALASLGTSVIEKLLHKALGGLLR